MTIIVTNTDLTIGQTGTGVVSGATVTINGNITIAGSQTRTISLSTSCIGGGANAVSIVGSIGATSSGSSTINLTSNGTLMGTNQSFTISGSIGGATGVGSTVTISNVNAGTGSLTISGALGQSVTSVTQNSATSALSLSGANTNFAGSILLLSGTLNLGSATALGGNGSATGVGGTLTIADNTSLNTTSTADVALTTVNAQQWNGSFTFVGSGNLSFGTGAITMAGNTTITSNAKTLTENGAIGDSGSGFSLTKLGAGGLVLAGANTYTGATTIGTAGSSASGGTLTINGTAGSINTSSSVSIYGNGGKLFLDNTAGNVDRVKDTGNVTMGLGGELSLTGYATTDTTEAIGGVSVGGGNSIITVTSTTGRVTTLAASSLTRTGNGTALVRGTNLNQSATTNVSRITLSTAPSGADFVGTSTLNNGATNDATKDLKIVPWLIGDTSANGTGANFVTYDSTLGFRVLTSSEQTTLTAGSTTAANPVNAIAFSGTVTAASGITVNSLLFSGTGGTLNSSGDSTPVLTVNSGAVAQVTGTAGAIGSGWSKLLLGNGEGVITVTQSTLTINTPVDVTSSGGLTKSGAGTLVLAASNLYTGQTTVNQGTLQIGTGTTGDLGSNTANIVLNGGTLSFGRTNAGLTISNAISGVGGVTQNGAGGTTILSASNTYTGATTITNDPIGVPPALPGRLSEFDL